MPITIDISPEVQVIRHDANQENLYYCEVQIQGKRHTVWLQPDTCMIASYRGGQGGMAWRDALPDDKRKVKSIVSELSKQNSEWLFQQEVRERLVPTN